MSKYRASTMIRPRLLDLFSGAGGAAMGYHQAGFDVVGVDIRPQPHYLFEFHQADALTYCPPGGFAAIHASPPCQSWTAYRRRGANVGEGYPDLIYATRQLLRSIGLPYVIENIPGAPLKDPIMLCGSSFGLDMRRHRLFEFGFFEPCIIPPCAHGWQTARFPQATNRQRQRRTVEIGVWRIPLPIQQQAMGIDWMTREELSEAIPPVFTRFIGEQLLIHLGAAA